LFQVDLSDSENDWGSDEEGGGKGGPGPDDVTMGKRRGGDLGVNKKGTPLYSREDIREQYCINDKELQVLDRQGSKGFFGCFSNQGQVQFIHAFIKKIIHSFIKQLIHAFIK